MRFPSLHSFIGIGFALGFALMVWVGVRVTRLVLIVGVGDRAAGLVLMVGVEDRAAGLALALMFGVGDRLTLGVGV